MLWQRSRLKLDVYLPDDVTTKTPDELDSKADEPFILPLDPSSIGVI